LRAQGGGLRAIMDVLRGMLRGLDRGWAVRMIRGNRGVNSRGFEVEEAVTVL